uniref:Spen paralogue and orthologue SPOC C-terminal domain-containing protein n=1 Tax=Davidia involucrata TaxID=16924 RepID=A0A5B7BGZ1_DAVIN
MWHEKQENIILSGQATCPPKSLQGPHMENKIIPPPSGNIDKNFLGGSSRKRKSAAMDPPKSVFEYSIPWESNLQQASSLSGINIQGNAHGPCLNQPKSVKPITFRHQFEKDQFHYQNDFAGTWPTSNENLLRSGIEKISNSSVSMPSQSLHYKGPMIDMQIGETRTVSNQKPQACNMFGETETQKSYPFLTSCNVHAEKAQVDPRLQDLMSFGIKNHVVTDKMPLENLNTQSERLRPVEISRHSFLQPNRFSDDLDGRTWCREANKFGISCEFRQSGQHSSNAGINDVPTVGSTSLGGSVCTEQNEVQFGSAPLGIHLGETCENKERGHGDNNIKIKEKIEASNMENLKHTLTEEVSPKNGDSPTNIVGHGQNNDLSHGSLKLNEKSKLHSGKAASTVAEKLWDGSLQLNSSVTVSTVAFFKSGEKLLDINWSEFVEVKGKVRLEAFEKYIQDLPRSRNRGLMVISLCWKEGSPETGLTGMKEVAKGYKKGERVGFAQLSPGIDLYICPRSDTIITILAKYGFFKGMAAVEDNQDSLIGCVVWRKNRTSSNSVARKSESKNTSSEQPLNSPSDSSTQQVAEIKLSPPPVAQEFLSLVSVAASSTLESAGKNGLESKHVDPREVQSEVGNSFSGANSLPTPSILSNFSSTLVGSQRSTHSNSASLQVSQGQLLEGEAPTRCSGLEQSKASLELENPVVPPPSDVLKQSMPTSDDDDLPEFDFGTACGISQTKMSKPLDAVMFDKRVSTEGTRKMDESVLPTKPIVQVMSVSNQRSDHSTLPRLPLASSQGMPLPKRSCEHESQIPVLPNLEEKLCPQSKATPVSTTGFAPPKNLFDDDDDIPEWCPPEHHKQALAETTRPSTTIPSEFPNSTFQNIPPGPPWPRPILPSPSPAATRPLFSSQPFPPAFHCPITVTVKAPQPRPFPRGPSPSMGFNSNMVLRPHPSSFDVKLPFQPADNRGWRPR